MRFLRTDLRRIFTEPTFRLSAALGLLLYLGAMAYLLITNGTEGLYSRSRALVYPFAAPLLAAMPYSVMIMTERRTRYGTLMRVRLGGGYRFRRFVTVGISGAAALLIPQAVLFGICAALGGVADYGQALREMVLPMTFGFGWSAIAYGLTFVNKQSYIPLVMPEVLYLLCVYAFPHLGLERFYPPLDIAPSVYGATVTADRFLLPGVLALAGLLFTAVFGKISGDD